MVLSYIKRPAIPSPVDQEYHVKPILFLVFAIALAVNGSPLEVDFGVSPLAPYLSEGQDLQRYAVRPLTAEPSLDGQLNDAVWQALPSMTIADDPAGLTTARLFRQGQTLFIAIACPQPADKATRAQAVDRDSKIWGDDCVELWLQAGESRYQFIVNAAGSIFDSKNRQASYDADWRHVVHHGDGQWSVELALPSTAIGLESWPAQLQANIGRNGPGRSPSSWGSSYGDTTNSALRFQGIDPTRSDTDAPGRETTVRLSVETARTTLRPGERWLAFPLAVQAPPGSRLVAQLFAPRQRDPIAEQTIWPERKNGTLRVDLRRPGLAQGRVVVSLLQEEQLLAHKAFFVHADPDRTIDPGQVIPVHLDLPETLPDSASYPVQFGIPLPAGAVWELGDLRLETAAGDEIPALLEVAGRWYHEGAIKWVRAEASVVPAEGLQIRVAAPTAEPTAPVRVSQTEDGLILANEWVRYRLSPDLSPIAEIVLAGRRLAWSNGTRGLYVIDQQGREASIANGDLQVEAESSTVATIRHESDYLTAGGEVLAHQITRITLYAGASAASIQHTLVLNRDTNEIWFTDIGWEFQVAPGEDSAALFGASRESWNTTLRTPLQNDKPATVLQDEHYFFSHGRNHYAIRDAEGALLREGEEMADWAALAGTAGGLAVSIRDAAHQHPKELLISPDRLVIKLFSPAAGEELDFRAATLVKKWQLDKLYDRALNERYRNGQEDRVANMPSNAIGWAKTHDLLLLPFSADMDAATVANRSQAHSREIFATVDPAWTYRTLALGPLHPAAPDTYPQAEALIRKTVDGFRSNQTGHGHYGFIDYGTMAGFYRHGIPTFKRNRNTYSLRGDLWNLYARSASRDIRAFAQLLNRTYMDGYMAHWDADKKTKGLLILPTGSETIYGDTQQGLPIYWEDRTGFSIGGTTDLGPFINDYYLTGNRRSREVIEEFAAGMKRAWTPNRGTGDWRVIRHFYTLVQAYGLTWDPTLRAMAEFVADDFIVPESEVWMDKGRPYGTLYKLESDFICLYHGWQQLGHPAYREVLDRTARYLWQNSIGSAPAAYGNADGYIGYHLYNTTGDPGIAGELQAKIRRLVAVEGGRRSVADIPFTLRGIAWAQDVIRHAGGRQPEHSAWAAGMSTADDLSIIAWKPVNQRVVLTGQFAGLPQAVDPANSKEYGLNSSHLWSSGYGQIVLAEDTPPGPFRIQASSLRADARVPMMLLAPNYWRPDPQTPAPPIYFRVPEQTQQPRIFFETETSLTDPDAKPFGHGKVRGWVELPADRPGLWSFRMPEPGMVKAQNLPPLFAMGDAAFYKDTPIAWPQVAPTEPPKPPAPDTVYVDGISGNSDDQALYLTGRQRLILARTDNQPLLSAESGTIEFFYRPYWGSFHEPETRLLLRLPTAGTPWYLTYYQNPEAGHWSQHQTLYASFTGLRQGLPTATMRAFRSTILEPGEWVHIAWVWSIREGVTPRGDDAFVSQLFVNGKSGKQPVNTTTFVNGRAEHPPLSLWLQGNLHGAVDELRLSTTARYQRDFVPPSPESPLNSDARTHLLLHFNGNLDISRELNSHSIEIKLEK